MSGTFHKFGSGHVKDSLRRWSFNSTNVGLNPTKHHFWKNYTLPKSYESEVSGWDKTVQYLYYNNTKKLLKGKGISQNLQYTVGLDENCILKKRGSQAVVLS